MWLLFSDGSCHTHSDCENGSYCDSNRCVSPCENSLACPNGVCTTVALGSESVTLCRDQCNATSISCESGLCIGGYKPF